MAGDPYKYFRVEAAELHAELGKGVLDLESGTLAQHLVPRLLRIAHTLKGAARVVKQPAIADHAHALEEVLSPFRESAAAVPRDQIEHLLRLVDGIGERVRTLAPPVKATAQAEVHPPPGRPVAASEEGFRTVRADVDDMDALLDSIGEAHIQLGTVRRSQGALERARHLVDILVEQLSSPRARDGARAGDLPAAAKTQSLAQELQGIFAGLERGIASGVDQLEQELRQVRETAEHMRLVAASALFTSLERAVRDVAHAQGKSVTFEGRGGTVRLDAHVLGVVQPALVQLVRNAVAHGLESPADRRASGKPVEGRVVLEVSRRGRRAAFTCRDDGRGVDLEAVRTAAERKGLLGGENIHPARDELLALLLRGGLSTATSVTELSGRGIGLDVLREVAERLRGDVSAHTDIGRGTTVELVVPLSLASLQALLVHVAGAAVAIPLDAVRATLRFARSDVARTAQGESLVHDGTVIPFVALSRLLSARAASGGLGLGSAVIVEGRNGRCALGVEALAGIATVIQRPLPDLAPSTSLVAGASMDADGNPQLVLDPDGLVAAALGAGRLAEPSVPVRRRVLVIDDSLTTRMLEQSILESAGYHVDVASSGEEGLEKARLERYALFLVDVEMPGMDGFTFIEQARADASLREVPAILVTSRVDAADLRRGQEVGAMGHIAKGEFDQNALLARIRELVR